MPPDPPIPVNPVSNPHKLPLVAGVGQALVSAWGTFKLASLFGLAGEGAIIAGGAVASVITSVFHLIAHKYGKS